jgi:O-antigen/teichoic acid export membrane protein
LKELFAPFLSRGKGASSLNESYKPKTAHQHFGRNILSNWAAYAVSLAVGFLISPLLVHKLGDTAYGIWALSLQFGAYISVLDLGVRIALTRYITHYHARDEMDRVHEAFTVGVTALGIIGVLSLLVTFVLVHFLPSIVRVPTGMQSAARWTLLLVGIQVALSFPGAIFAGMLAALSRYDLLNATVITISIAKALLIWLLLTNGHGLLAVAVVWLVTACITYILQFALASRLYGGFRYHLSRAQIKSTLKPLLNFGFFAFLLGISGRLVLWSDNIVIGIILGPAMVTFYAIAGNLIDYLQGLLSSSLSVLVPLATSYDARSEEEKLQSLFSNGSRFLLLLFLPAIIAVLVLGPGFISLWMGAGYVEMSGKVLVLLVIPLVFAPMRGAAQQILYGSNRHKFSAFISLGEAIANLALSIILAYRIGAVGVAWGTLIPGVLSAGIILPVYTLRRLAMNWRGFYWNSFLLPVLAGLPYMGLLYLTRSMGLASNLVKFFATVLGSLPFYYLFVWFFVLKGPEQEMVRSQVRVTLRQPAS